MILSMRQRNTGFALAAAAALTGSVLPGCDSRDKDSYQGAASSQVEAASGSRWAPLNPKHQRLFDAAHRLDEALVTFLNSCSSVIGNTSYHYSTSATAHEAVRTQIEGMQKAVDDLLLTDKGMPPSDRNLLVEYTEGLGEGRGAIFDARKVSLLVGEVQFSGEGMNDLHGLRAQTQALLAALAKPPEAR